MSQIEWLAKAVQNRWVVRAEHTVSVAVLIYGLYYLKKYGFKSILASLFSGGLKIIPGASSKLDNELEKEVTKTVKEMFHKSNKEDEECDASVLQIPKTGVDVDTLLDILKQLKKRDGVASEGKMWAYTYDTNIDQHFELLVKVYEMFAHENALNPVVFPALRKFETEVLAMSANMLGGDSDTVGTMTTGGTESILMALKCYRDLALKERGITHPEVIVPATIHVAFDKAAHYFGLKLVKVPIGSDLRADVKAMEKQINSNTILLVGSAPQYPHGVIDPIEELSTVALKHKLYLHVDSCVGGFILPWIKKLGYDIPNFDFSVPGVTSMSADIHKYGYALKGTSVVLYRNSKIRQHQFFAVTDWCGGLYVSPSMTGTRSGGLVAAAWTCLQRMGEDGYMELAQSLMDTRDYLLEHINEISGFKVLGSPHMSILSFISTDPDVHIFAVADAMEEMFGWHIERQPNPYCIHLSITPPHVNTKGQFIEDLKKSLQEVKENPDRFNGKGSVAMYGMVAKIPAEICDRYVMKFLDKVYKVDEQS
eukprot:TRINITY_DN2134_c0_g1_i1.p1 TRINITY_DN2134_c0_g1~~TRINITY_DN2134_c0_g1_i1.p1  ORF type:complete len:538 (+),score=100.19 TRINITY_DN2134_c0_g1_i1:115-1728(+)